MMGQTIGAILLFFCFGRRGCLAFIPPSRAALCPKQFHFEVQSSNDDNNNNGQDERGNESNPFQRFLAPKIEDPGLPLTDTLNAQIVGPALQIFSLSAIGAPKPSWLRPIFDTALWEARGSLLAPTLIHGAELACCWIAGALAAEAYEFKSIDPTVQGWGTVIGSIIKAGAFASGLLILATQIDLLLEFGRNVQPGESPETDLRLVRAAFEVASDVFFEALVIGGFRFYLAFSTAVNKSQ